MSTSARWTLRTRQLDEAPIRSARTPVDRLAVEQSDLFLLGGRLDERLGRDRAEEIAGETIPERCRPDGVKPYELIYDVETIP